MSRASTGRRHIAGRPMNSAALSERPSRSQHTAFAAGLLMFVGTAAAQDLCGPLAVGDTFGPATITAATTQPAGPDAMAHCEVRATIRPEPGSSIGAVFRLPEDWNGKVLGVGGGGFAGNLTVEVASEGLERGYAVIQNDLGHPSTSALDPSFAVGEDGRPNVPGIVDFGHRATHLATVAGKAVVERAYGSAPDYAYWQGCSTGGRQGLAEVQRYPGDYDGVIAGAPVYTPLTYSNAMLRVQAFHREPGSNLLPAHVPLIEQSVLAACDALDGVTDGILTDPRRCDWDPAELRCSAGDAPSTCLTDAQVETVRTVYNGVRTPNGSYAAMPLMRGGESDWARRMIGNEAMPLGLNALLGAPFMSYIVAGNPDYDILDFDPAEDMAALEPEALLHRFADLPDLVDQLTG